MRRSLLLPFLIASLYAAAQCPFDVEVGPIDLIMCPGESGMLSSSPHETYQWYREGVAIPGATSQDLVVDYFNDSGASFSVLVSEEGCFEMSASVLVDGWVFLPPFVMHEGEEPIAIGPFGEPTYCEGAFVQLTLGLPYSENIQWTLEGLPIPGANSPSLVVTAPGGYSVSGAPAVCPASMADLGLTIQVAFQDSIQPVIDATGDVLCAVPTGEFHQWYLNSTPLSGGAEPCITTAFAGVYSVYVDYGHGCQVVSAPYFSTSLEELTAARPWNVYPSPSEGGVSVVWNGVPEPGTFWSVLDQRGRSVREGFMPTNGLLTLDLGDLPAGTYLFQGAQDRRALGPATRFTLLR